MEDNAPEATASDNVLLGGYQSQPSAAPAEPEGQAQTPTEQPINGEWTSAFDDETKGYIENKAWRDPADMLQSYRNLEKMSGGNAEQLYRITGDMEDDARSKVYDALGRPESPDKYGYETQEGDSPELVEHFKNISHKLGLSESQVSQMIPALNEEIIKLAEAGQGEINAKNAQGFDQLKAKWGDGSFDMKVNYAHRAANHFGISEDIQRAVVASGHAAEFTEALSNIGSLMAEGNMVGMSPDSSRASMGAMTREEAQRKIDEKLNNDDFKKRYLSQDHATRIKAREELEPYRKLIV